MTRKAFLQLLLVPLVILLSSARVSEPRDQKFYSGSASLVVQNNLNIAVDDVYIDSDIDAEIFGSVAASATEYGSIQWNSNAITIDLYLATIPRGGGTIRIYENNTSTLVHSIPLTSTQHYYTYIYYNPPASGSVLVHIDP